MEHWGLHFIYLLLIYLCTYELRPHFLNEGPSQNIATLKIGIYLFVTYLFTYLLRRGIVHFLKEVLYIYVGRFRSTGTSGIEFLSLFICLFITLRHSSFPKRSTLFYMWAVFRVRERRY